MMANLTGIKTYWESRKMECYLRYFNHKIFSRKSQKSCEITYRYENVLGAIMGNVLEGKRKTEKLFAKTLIFKPQENL